MLHRINNDVEENEEGDDCDDDYSREAYANFYADVTTMIIQVTAHCYNDVLPPDFGVYWTMRLDL